LREKSAFTSLPNRQSELKRRQVEDQYENSVKVQKGPKGSSSSHVQWCM